MVFVRCWRTNCRLRLSQEVFPKRRQLPPWSAAWDETRGRLLFSEKGLLPARVTLGLVPGPQGDHTERKL